jgi:hypothetical protein
MIFEDGLRDSHAREETESEHPLLAPDLLALKVALILTRCMPRLTSRKLQVQ